MKLHILPMFKGTFSHDMAQMIPQLRHLIFFFILQENVSNGYFMDDDDEFRFNDPSTHEGHLHQNGVLTWFCMKWL